MEIKMRINDTIAAVATPRGKGGIAMIRISGEHAVAVAERVFRPRSGKALSDVGHGRSVYGNIMRAAQDGREICIDDGMAVVMRAPHSFTGEDTVEICCHGGVLITQCVLMSALEAGARMAEAGEFTRRAFINGKLKLTQAQALGNLLEAENENQLLISRSGMRGVFSESISVLYEKLRFALASIYARIDFPDEELADMSREDISVVVEEVISSVESLAGTYKVGRAVSEGVRTVVCGHANVGKSSVYNRIVGRDAAIVTDIAGTTRDVLHESTSFGGVTLRLGDTAGIRDTEDVVEKIGIDRALCEIESAELILAVLDPSCEMSAEDKSFYRKLTDGGKKVIGIYNKSDIYPTHADISDVFTRTVSLSALTGEGFDKLESVIKDMYFDGEINLYDDAVVADGRQYAALLNAAQSLRTARGALEGGLPLDLCCIDIEEAMSHLGEIDGREISEDIVSEIFSKFCVGK